MAPPAPAWAKWPTPWPDGRHNVLTKDISKKEIPMKLNPSEISNLIRSRIDNFEALTQARTEGTVVSVTDGIVRVHGLSDVMQGEMLEFPGNTFGLALNLERDSVGAVILGEYEHITEGDTVKC